MLRGIEVGMVGKAATGQLVNWSIKPTKGQDRPTSLLEALRCPLGLVAVLVALRRATSHNRELLKSAMMNTAMRERGSCNLFGCCFLCGG